ncbi:indole-3-glycerol phosphate synthase TrpC [Desulfospira joergensenii]|uniref:indole-3-glycerol phosphate synthase TrpC n=1 Tax=Desulfospira joergensenii TaxID=53329 RepID=UPI0003B49E8B|nr:indole-3-glycerol phosphate synthase TrpC [Desulfospira joergensenii]
MGVSGFLKTILEIKQEEVAAGKTAIPLAILRREAEDTPIPASFEPVMAKSSPKDPGIIAEIKKASPSKGDIRPDLDPKSYAKEYTRAGARAISVLTESRYFKGSLKDLEIACSATDLPVLRKDFIISSFQIFEAKKAGASAVLLITTMLSRDQQRDFTLLTRELGMEPLVEINSEFELDQALFCGAKVVGINNRNLSTLEVDVTAAQRIAAIFPDDIIPVEASGISGRAGVEKGLENGIFNFLVGESIVRAADTRAFIRSLRGEE